MLWYQCEPVNYALKIVTDETNVEHKQTSVYNLQKYVCGTVAEHF